MTTSPRMVTGLFTDRTSAECAYRAAANFGYEQDEVSVLMSEETRNLHFANGAESALGERAAEGAGVGAAIGGTTGAVLAAVAAIGTSLALPGLGLVVAGPVAAALAGAGAGGATGGIVGALVGSGLPEERAQTYESGLREGGIVLGVLTDSDDDLSALEESWRDCGGENIHS